MEPSKRIEPPVKFNSPALFTTVAVASSEPPDRLYCEVSPVALEFTVSDAVVTVPFDWFTNPAPVPAPSTMEVVAVRA